jgi:NAD(P)-dependent dehydrogenase (short-subunit alcohol dehydrogenase family)
MVSSYESCLVNDFHNHDHFFRIQDIPLRRIGTPADAGRAILAVVSPLFSYVTGEVSN